MHLRNSRFSSFLSLSRARDDGFVTLSHIQISFPHRQEDLLLHGQDGCFLKTPENSIEERKKVQCLLASRKFERNITRSSAQLIQYLKRANMWIELMPIPTARWSRHRAPSSGWDCGVHSIFLNWICAIKSTGAYDSSPKSHGKLQIPATFPPRFANCHFSSNLHQREKEKLSKLSNAREIEIFRLLLRDESHALVGCVCERARARTGHKEIVCWRKVRRPFHANLFHFNTLNSPPQLTKLYDRITLESWKAHFHILHSFSTSSWAEHRRVFPFPFSPFSLLMLLLLLSHISLLGEPHDQGAKASRARERESRPDTLPWISLAHLASERARSMLYMCEFLCTIRLGSVVHDRQSSTAWEIIS